MSHLFHDNLSFITVRRSEIGGIPAHFFCSNEMSVLHSISAKESNFVFPLYLYRHEEKKDLFSAVSGGTEQGRRTPNLGKKLIENLSHLLGLRFVPEGMGDLAETWGPEDLFNYIYAISQSSTYRKRYAEQLGIDFPKFPLTRRIDLFRELGAEGRTLVDLHLTRRLLRVQTSYPIAGNNVVKAVRYVPSNAEVSEGRVWINKTQYFEGVGADTWTFQIGGYQVAHKWLKDRKNRDLTYTELAHYQNIIAVIDETRRIMSAIDSIIERNGGWPLS